MKRLRPLLKALGTQFNSEHTETVSQFKLIPYGGDIRKLIENSEQIIRVTTRIETWECLWWNGHNEQVWVDYHVIHHLKSGHKLAYHHREPNTTIVDVHKLQKLYDLSIPLVFTTKPN